MSDSDYFAQREQAEILRAQQARDPAVRHIHLTMASAYRQRRIDSAAEKGPRQDSGLRLV